MDKKVYMNADSKCECCKCEVKSICKVHDKMQRHSRAKGGLGLCPKLDDKTFAKFIERHLDEYNAIAKKGGK